MKLYPAAASTYSISVTATASTGTAFDTTPSDAADNTIRLINEGPNNCYIAVGGAAVAATVPTGTAAVTSTPVLAGSEIVLYIAKSQTHISAICRTSETATLLVSNASGV